MGYVVSGFRGALRPSILTPKPAISAAVGATFMVAHNAINAPHRGRSQGYAHVMSMICIDAIDMRNGINQSLRRGAELALRAQGHVKVIVHLVLCLRVTKL